MQCTQYTAKQGDTLRSIAKSHRLPTEILVAYNTVCWSPGNLPAGKVSPGDIINIPSIPDAPSSGKPFPLMLSLQAALLMHISVHLTLPSNAWKLPRDSQYIIPYFTLETFQSGMILSCSNAVELSAIPQSQVTDTELVLLCRLLPVGCRS